MADKAIQLPAKDPWVVRRKPRSSPAVRLFCFPYAGGGSAVFQPWTSELPEDIDVCAVQLPGREHRIGERPVDSLSALLPLLLKALRPYLEGMEGRFAFFGHSMGALVSFELTRALRRQGGPLPRMLFASGRVGPTCRMRNPPLAGLPDQEFVAAISARYGGIPAAVLKEPELMALLLPMLRADMRIHETYVYVEEPALALPIYALGGTEDPLVTEEELLAWQQETTGPFKVQRFPGGHFFLNELRSQVLAAIKTALA